MEHPFALQKQLGFNQLSKVTGAGNCATHTSYSPSCLVASVPENLRQVIRPPFASTQAIGEEGGSFPEQSDF